MSRPETPEELEASARLLIDAEVELEEIQQIVQEVSISFPYPEDTLIATRFQDSEGSSAGFWPTPDSHGDYQRKQCPRFNRQKSGYECDNLDPTSREQRQNSFH